MAKKNSDGVIIYRHVPILPSEYHKNPTAWPRGNIGKFFFYTKYLHITLTCILYKLFNSDLYTTAGEYNANARIQVAQFAEETAAWLHNVAKRNDSGQNCPRAKEGQPVCEDGLCPDCNSTYICVDQIHGEAILGVTAQNLINQIPSEVEEDNLTKNFGHAEYEKVDSKRFNPSRGIKLSLLVINYES